MSHRALISHRHHTPASPAFTAAEHLRVSVDFASSFTKSQLSRRSRLSVSLLSFPTRGCRSSKRRCAVLKEIKKKNHVRRLSANSPVIIIWQVAECAETLSIWRDLGRDNRGTERLFLKKREAREHAGHVPHLPLPAPHGRVLIRALGGWAGAISLNANGRFLHGRRAPPKISPHERDDLAERSAAQSNGRPHVVVVVVVGENILHRQRASGSARR